MSTTISSPEPLAQPKVWAVSRMTLGVAAGIGVLVMLSLLLWAKYGAAAYYEAAANSLGLCF